MWWVQMCHHSHERSPFYILQMWWHHSQSANPHIGSGCLLEYLKQILNIRTYSEREIESQLQNTNHKWDNTQSNVTYNLACLVCHYSNISSTVHCMSILCKARYQFSSTKFRDIQYFSWFCLKCEQKSNRYRSCN